MAEPTYHMAIWDEPPTYVCLVCNAQPLATKLDLVAHLTTRHQVEAVPTPLAAQTEAGLVPPLPGVPMADATYYTTTTADGTTIYHCHLCDAAGTEHHATDIDLFQAHMLQRHGGEMVEGQKKPDAAPDHPHEEPPGQAPDFVPPGHGGTPPGQEGQPEPDPEPEPKG